MVFKYLFLAWCTMLKTLSTYVKGMNTSFNPSSHSRNMVINEVNICETNCR